LDVELTYPRNVEVYRYHDGPKITFALVVRICIFFMSMRFMSVYNVVLSLLLCRAAEQATDRSTLCAVA